MKVRILQFTALVTQFLAFVLGFTILFSGRGNQSKNAYLVHLNTSTLGRDALINSNLFAFNNTNLIFAAATASRHSQNVGIAGNEAAQSANPRSGLSKRQQPANPADFLARITTIAENAIDFVTTRLMMSPDAPLPAALKKAVRTSMDNVQKGTITCATNMQNQIRTDVSLIMADTLTKMAETYKLGAIGIPPSPAPVGSAGSPRSGPLPPTGAGPLAPASPASPAAPAAPAGAPRPPVEAAAAPGASSAGTVVAAPPAPEAGAPPPPPAGLAPQAPAAPSSAPPPLPEGPVPAAPPPLDKSGDKPKDGEKAKPGDKAKDDKSKSGEKSKDGKKPPGGEKPPGGDKPAGGDKPPGGDKPTGGDKPPGGEKKANAKLRRSDSGSKMPSLSMSRDEADYVSYVLASEIRTDNELSFAVRDGISRAIEQWNTSTPVNAASTKMKMIQGLRDADAKDPNPGMQALERAIRVAAPTFSDGLSLAVTRTMNSGVENIKREVPIYDWYAFYETVICWGKYETNQQGKTKQKTYGCGNTAMFRDMNLSPFIMKLFETNGLSPRLPEKIGVGRGLEDTFRGLTEFMKVIYGLHVITVLNLTFAFVGTVMAIAMSLLNKLHGSWARKAFLFNCTTCAGAAMLVYSNAMVMTLVLSGMGYMLPGSLGTASVQVHIGGTYLALCWVSTVFTLVGTGCWYALWRQLSMKAEYKRGIKRGREKERDKIAGEIPPLIPDHEKDGAVPVMLDQGDYRF